MVGRRPLDAVPAKGACDGQLLTVHGRRKTNHHRLRIPAMSWSMGVRFEDKNTCPTLLNSELASPSKALLLRDLDCDE